MVTLKDIAEKSGVSRGTVDRVLNNRGRVSKEKEELVRKTAEELGYQPNIAGRGLAARKKQLKLGFCYPGDAESVPFYQEVYRGAFDYAEKLKQYGVTVFFFPIAESQYNDCEFIAELVENQMMDGWAADGYLASSIREELRKTGKEFVPLVVYNMDISSKDRLAYVGCDYLQAGRLACGVAALMTDGKAQVGIVSLDRGDSASSYVRIQGFEKEMQENYSEMRIVAKQFMDEEEDQFDFFLAVQEIVRQHKEMDVLYLVNPGNYSICQAVHKAGKAQAVKIITNDLVLESQREMVRNGQISATICQEPEKQGAKPLEILFEYLALGKKPEKEWYKTELSVLFRQNV